MNSYQTQFEELWKEVQTSAKAGTFAKLTLAKTIGKQNLKNVFLRPTRSEAEIQVLVKKHYRSSDTVDIDTKMTLDAAREVVESNLNQPFKSAILFTTQKDLTLKINKKGAGSLVESLPTFSEVVLGEMD